MSVIELRELMPFVLPVEATGPQFRFALGRASQSLKVTLGLSSDPFQVWQEDGQWKIRAEGIAGVLSIMNREIEVRPKFLEPATTVDWRRGLLRLVEIAAGTRLGFSAPVSAAVTPTSFYDHVGIAFAQLVRHASESGPVLLYRRIPEELPYLRGRLLVGQQLQLLHSRPAMVAQEVELLLSDNPITRLLKWATEFLRSRVRTATTRAQLDWVERVLPGIPPELPDVTILERLSLPPQHEDWREAFDLARVLGRSQAVGFGQGSTLVPGIVFDTVGMFERLVGILLARAAQRARSLGENWWTAGKVSTEWLFPQQSGEPVRSVTPDGELRIGSDRRLLIDAKYKGRPEMESLTPPRPSREDLYECAVFMGASNCNRMLLLYPRVESTEAAPTTLRVYRANLMGKDVTFCSATVDLVTLAQGDMDRVIRGLHSVVIKALNA